MVEKIKTYVGRLLLVLTTKINFPIYFAKIELSFNFETKSSLPKFSFIFFTISQIFEGKFYVFFRYKHVET